MFFVGCNSRETPENYIDFGTRAYGVINFYPDRLADFCVNVDVKPAVNQIELHPFFAQRNALEKMAENFDIWNFRLSDAEMAEIDTLDLGHS